MTLRRVPLLFSAHPPSPPTPSPSPSPSPSPRSYQHLHPHPSPLTHTHTHSFTEGARKCWVTTFMNLLCLLIAPECLFWGNPNTHKEQPHAHTQTHTHNINAHILHYMYMCEHICT